MKFLKNTMMSLQQVALLPKKSTIHFFANTSGFLSSKQVHEYYTVCQGADLNCEKKLGKL